MHSITQTLDFNEYNEILRNFRASETKRNLRHVKMFYSWNFIL